VAIFSRTKNWGTEVLTDADLEAQLDLIINNLVPAMIEDYSATLGEMQTETDPYPASVASLATSLAGEIERLRYQITQLTGESNWYKDPNKSIKKMVNTGTYSGDNTENRAITHGLGSTPIFVIIRNNFNAAHTAMVKDTTLVAYTGSSAVQYTVTSWGSTYFYVGDATFNQQSQNTTGTNYTWIAFG